MDFNKKILVMDGGVGAEDEALRLKLMPTLQHMAAVRLAIIIWEENNAECVDWIKFEEGKFDKLFRKKLLEVKNNEKLPEKIHSHLIFVLRGMNYELDLWRAFHTQFAADFRPWKYFNSIQWTSRGRVNYVKTAQIILSDNTLNPSIISELKILYADSTPEQRLSALYSKWESSFSSSMHIPYKLSRINFSWVNLFEFLKEFFQDSQGVLLRQTVTLPQALGYHPIDDCCMIISQFSFEEQDNLFSTDHIFKITFLSEDWLWRDYFMPVLDKHIEDVEYVFLDLIRALADCYAVGYFPEWHRDCLAEILDINFETFEEIDFDPYLSFGNLNQFIYSLRVDKLYQPLYIDILSVVFASESFSRSYLYYFERNAEELTPENMIRELSHSQVIYDLMPEEDPGIKFYSAYPSMVSYLLSVLFDQKDILQAENTCYFFPKDLKPRFLEHLISVPEFVDQSHQFLFSKQFEIYSQILDFVFCGRQEEITAYKATVLLNYGSILDSEFLISFKAAELDQPWDVLKSILEFCFEDKREFKEWHLSEKKLDYQEKLLSIMDYFFGISFELAVAFFNWWFDSDTDKDTIQLVKRDYFLCYHIRNSHEIKERLREKMESGTPQMISSEYFSVLTRLHFSDLSPPIKQEDYQNLVTWIQPSTEILRFIQEPC